MDTDARAVAADVAEAEPPEALVTDRVWTVPNALSALRLAGVPVFLWLLLGPQADGLAILLLMAAGISDWADGMIARRYGSYSRLGQLLDPAADRLYIASTVVALTLRDVVPLWVPLALLARDVVLACALPVLRRHGYGPLPVHFLGKAATFNLLYAFPMLLGGVQGGWLEAVFLPLGWAFALWGIGLYWWSGVLYLVQVRQVVTAARAER